MTTANLGFGAKFIPQKNTPRGIAALDQATNLAHGALENFFTVKPGSLVGKEIAIIGAGIAGLTAAYELSKSGAKITVFEALPQTGGRCLTLRTGDVLTEDKDSDLHSTGGTTTQHVNFRHVPGDQEPYLNAGPGRIPSTHTYLLDYLRQFRVDLEVYVMQSGSNLTQLQEKGPLGPLPIANRRYQHNARGWLAEMVYQNASDLIEKSNGPVTEDMAEALRNFMKTFGDLNSEGKYVVGANNPGEDSNPNASSRAGYITLPGAQPGKVASALPFKDILASGFWDWGIYQHDDILWQPTLFQPVGGMDMVSRAFENACPKENVSIAVGSAVEKISYSNETNKYEVVSENCAVSADYVLCNVGIPFLKKMISNDLFQDLPSDFQDGLNAVFELENKEPLERFFSNTTKVGWQAKRSEWQSSGISVDYSPTDAAVLHDNDSELGVVPIYGGISWTDDPITQIWYPSTGYNDELGVLTGCYNFANNAVAFGNMSPGKRLCTAKEGAKRFGEQFGKSLHCGVALAWQNMPYIKGGWPQWYNVGDESVMHFNTLQQGTTPTSSGTENPTLFIIGDQMSTLPGWQEGAVTGALAAVSRIAKPGVPLPNYTALPDPRVMVEGLRF